MSDSESHEEFVDEIQKTDDLIEFDPATELTEEVLMDFDINPENVRTIKFKDEKGMEQSFDTVPLRYKGLPPYIVVERECYGVQSAEFKKKDAVKKPAAGAEHGMNPVSTSGMITLPSTLQQLSASVPEDVGDDENKEKPRIQKRKLQVALKLTEKPHPDDWTPEEAAVIKFCNDGIRKIWSHVLSRHLAVLNSACPNIIPAVQETLGNDFQDPDIAAKYCTDELRHQYMITQIQKAIYNKFTKKVYRKKIKAAPGQKFDMNANPYDLTSNPGLYPLVKNYVDQKTGEEIVNSNFYKIADGLPQQEWPSVTLDEAMEHGRCRATLSIYFDEPFLGGAVLSPKFNVGECYLGEKIASKQGYKGRMVVLANRDKSKITKKKVTMEGSAPEKSIPTANVPMSAPQTSGFQTFDPSGFTMMNPQGQNIGAAPVQQVNQ